jgi:hypothetical protein
VLALVLVVLSTAAISMVNSLIIAKMSSLSASEIPTHFILGAKKKSISAQMLIILGHFLIPLRTFSVEAVPSPLPKICIKHLNHFCCNTPLFLNIVGLSISLSFLQLLCSP